MPESPKSQARKEKQIKNDLKLAKKMIDEVFNEIINDVITVVNVQPPEELENKDMIKEQADILFDPYKQRILSLY